MRFDLVNRVLLLISVGTKYLAKREAEKLTEEELELLEHQVKRIRDLVGVVSISRIQRLIKTFVTLVNEDLSKEYNCARYGAIGALRALENMSTEERAEKLTLSNDLILELLKLKCYWALNTAESEISGNMWIQVMDMTVEGVEYYSLTSEYPIEKWPQDTNNLNFINRLLENFDVAGTPLETFLCRVDPKNLKQVRRQSKIRSRHITLENLPEAIDSSWEVREGVGKFIEENNCNETVRQIVLSKVSRGSLDYTKYLGPVNDNEIDTVLGVHTKVVTGVAGLEWINKAFYV